MNALFARHNEEVEAYGPFAFFNPTIRRFPLKWANTEQSSSQEELAEGDKKDGDNGAAAPVKNIGNKEEVKASAIHRKWRSRDNRKGMFYFS